MPNRKSSPRLPYEFTNETQDLKCWSVIKEDGLLDSARIDKIEDDDASGRLMTAAVPNPLARIYLFKNAFEYFANGDKKFKEPNAPFVSDCLDFLQFLFENPNPDLIHFREWNINTQISNLRKSTNPKHKHLGETLDLFFDDDFKTNGFNTISLIYYKLESGKHVLIGGTSPFTLVYTSPNWKREIKDNNIKIESTNKEDTFFDGEYFSLEDRNLNFRIWLYDLAKENPNMTISNYINNIKLKKDKDLSISDINVEELFETIKIGQATLKCGNIAFKRNKQNSGDTTSDLKISPDKNVRGYNSNPSFPNGTLPLVLFQGMEFDGKYFGSTPYEKTKTISTTSPIHTRKIPGTEIKYPYLTTNDFFEEKLVRIPFQINDDQFYTGKVVDSNGVENDTFKEEYRYLLPIKTLFFDFFSPETLHNNLSFIYTANKIIFKLKIPISNNDYVELEKEYNTNPKEKMEISANTGLSIFPMVRYESDEDGKPLHNIHNIAALYESARNNPTNIDLKFFRQDTSDYDRNTYDRKPLVAHESERNKPNVLKSKRITSPEKGENKETTFTNHYHINSHFDFIRFELTNNEGSSNGLIVPRFKSATNGIKDFKAAIDFGTSNTFVAIREGNQPPEPLVFRQENEELLIGLLNKKNGPSYFDGFGAIQLDMTKAVQTEFAPPLIKLRNDEKYISFPIRTVSVESTFSFEQQSKSLFLFSNIAFYYEHDMTKDSDRKYKYKSNIKPLFEFNPSGDNKINVKNFLKELLLLIKCKIFLNGGNINKLQFIWSYPETGDFKKELQPIFDEASSEVFGVDSKLRNVVKMDVNISESLAPFIYLEKGLNITPNGYCINIDIGGGTTDIVIHKSSKEYFCSSVKFAGNDLWGGGTDDENIRDNGFTFAWEKANEDNILKANSTEIKRYRVLQDSSDVNASSKTNLLFRYNDILEFTQIFNNKQLKLDYLKYPLVVHFSAILYYVLSLCKDLNISQINSLSFSGKGSSYIDLILPGNQFINYVRFYFSSFSRIKDYVIESPEEDDNINLVKNPKEVTAYGAIYNISDENKGNEIKTESKYFLDFKVENSGGGARGAHSNKNKLSEEEIKAKTFEEIDYFISTLIDDDEIYKMFKSMFDFDKIYKNLHDSEAKKSVFEKLLDKSYVKTSKYYENSTNKGTRFFYPFKEGVFELSNHIFSVDWNKINN
jgi:hypothetical protein